MRLVPPLLFYLATLIVDSKYSAVIYRRIVFAAKNYMNLTKRNLVTRISEETGLNQAQVFAVVQKTLNYITESLAKGIKVELRNFGVFDVKIRRARVGRNPNRPKTDVPIPAHAAVKFKAGKIMRAEVLKLSPKH